MKNDQQNTQNKNQEQSLKNPGNPNENIQQDGDAKKVIPPPEYRNDSSSRLQKNSNTAVGKDGRIGKAHDDKDPGKNESSENNSNKGNEKDKQLKINKTVTEPEIDAPIYDPEKTEKKIPRMEGNK